MRRNLFIAGASAALLAFGFMVHAAAPAGITFPISELGGCGDEAACHAYCDDAAHIDACLSFGQSHGLIRKDDAARVRNAGFASGPGGCKGAGACRAYCEDTAHQQECIDFAEENGMMSHDDAARARTVTGQTGPGGCRGEQCRAYCQEAAHADECLSFAQSHGLIKPDEAAAAKKFLQATAEGGPGGCQGIQCRDYCGDPLHRDECILFAKSKGLIQPDVAKQIEAGQKIEQVVRESGGPGGCKNNDECRAYCADPAHVEECVAFAASHGNVSQDAARAMLKQFTEDRFAADAEGVPTPEDFQQSTDEQFQKFEEFRQLEEQFRGDAGAAAKFLNSSDDAMPLPPGSMPGAEPWTGGPQAGASDEGRHGMGFVGPGGCTSPAECIRYCAEHRDECFGSGRQQQSQDQSGDQGSQSPAGTGIRHLRTDILQQVRPGDLPQGFDHLSPEDRQKIFRRVFENSGAAMPPPPGSMPGAESGTDGPGAGREPGGLSPENQDNSFVAPEASRGASGESQNNFSGGQRGLPNPSPEFAPPGRGDFMPGQQDGYPRPQNFRSSPGQPGQAGSGSRGVQPGGASRMPPSFNGGQSPVNPTNRQFSPRRDFNNGSFQQRSFSGPGSNPSYPPESRGNSFQRPSDQQGGGSMPLSPDGESFQQGPPPNGGGGSMYPPPSGGGQPLPPPHSAAPFENFFAGIIQAFIR